jgi:hypothetical protein
MKNLRLILALCAFPFSVFAENTIYCSHPELCKMVDRIASENKVTDLLTKTLVTIVGDPHEFEPSAEEIKQLINAPTLLTGPQELNPWVKKILFKRSRLAGKKNITLIFGAEDSKLYSHVNLDALSHFWIYPKVYCSLKSKLHAELSLLHQGIKSHPKCDSQTVEKSLQQSLSHILSPIILTHDALLPLMHSLSTNKSQVIVAIKGSGHHEETGPIAIKKMYDALKAPKVIWIVESNISTPSNILNKRRPQDLLLTLDTAKSNNEDPFSALKELSAKLNQISEK